MAESTTPTGADVTRKLLDAIVTRDFDGLSAILAAAGAASVTFRASGGATRTPFRRAPVP